MHNNLQHILEKIELIDEIVIEKGSITLALRDEKLAKPAILILSGSNSPILGSSVRRIC